MIWQYVSKISSNFVMCSLCGKVFKYGGGTSNIKNHLRKHGIFGEILYITKGLENEKIQASAENSMTEEDMSEHVANFSMIENTIENEHNIFCDQLNEEKSTLKGK